MTDSEFTVLEEAYATERNKRVAQWREGKIDTAPNTWDYRPEGEGVRTPYLRLSDGGVQISFDRARLSITQFQKLWTAVSESRRLRVPQGDPLQLDCIRMRVNSDGDVLAQWGVPELRLLFSEIRDIAQQLGIA